ncbi:MAG TPA: tetratricopeptide repeat protein [Candidatus Sulfotelmatobacter sp.]|jgi:tetratricopeptide (TPR) repeat protein|nr:tetratricopeptide repeat protein [Candidatus Sulfotelmatobacter sp.]
MLDSGFKPQKRRNFLSWPGKKRRFAALSRREFLQYTQGAALAFLPAGLRFPSFDPKISAQDSSLPPEFHVHPVYRTPRAIESVLKKAQAEFDSFPTEIHQDQIARVLQAWSAELRASPQKTDSLERAMSDDFQATSPSGSLQTRRKDDGIFQVWEVKYQESPGIGRTAFLADWRSALRDFSKLLTVEFQITGIRAGSVLQDSPEKGVAVHTRVRYEFVGEGPGFHREQRIGNLDLDWELVPVKEARLRKWRNVEEARSRSLAPVFEDIAGLAFASCASFGAQLVPGIDTWRTALDGASGIDIYGHNGVAAGDIDGDGFDDLYVCQPAGLPNRLYRNRGDGTFEDITEASGVGILDNTACALFADFDNDGRQDLIVVRASGPLLFINAGGGKFRPRPDAFHFANAPQGTFTGAAIADYDRDGWLDIYFCLYTYYQGTDQYRYPMPYYAAENGPPNFLMRNQRDGSFRDVTRETGLDKNNSRFSFCCGWADFNGDGWPDLYVVNDFGRKNLYKNSGHGTFTDIAKEAGVEDVGAGMSVSWLDFDKDGRQDLYVADMWTAAGLRVSMQETFQQNASEEVRAMYRRHAMGNCLYRNRGDGKFEDAGEKSGTLMGRWAWSSDAWDFNHDGLPDLYVANGMISGPQRLDLNSFFWRQVVANSPESAKPSTAYEQGWNAVNELIRADATWSGYERNVLYLNSGDGAFSDVSGIAGMDFLEDSRTFALADFDHDGRLEVALKNRSGPQLRFLKNVMPRLGPAIAICLQGKKSNRDAIGAGVTIETNAGRQTKFVQAGSGFLAQHSKELHFGLGTATGLIQATIRWPSGLEQKVTDVPPNHRIWIEEGSPVVRKEPFLSSANRSQTMGAASAGPSEQLPTQVETWLLVPVAAPDFSVASSGGKEDSLSTMRGKPVLLHFGSSETPDWQSQLADFQRAHDRLLNAGLQLVVVNVEASMQAARWAFPIVTAQPELVAVYNLLYGRLFDRHRDMPLPTSFLIDAQGNIAKIYQGALRLKSVEADFHKIPKTAAERLALGLPFPGVGHNYDVGRNYLSFGSIFYERGYLDQAEAYFQLAENDDPTAAEPLYGLGSIYLAQQKRKEARQYFERAVKSRADYPPTLPNACNNLGILAAREGNTDEAIAFFQRALAINPDHAVALQNLGNAYRQKKDWDAAKKTLQLALALNPDDAEANYGLGMVYAQLNDTARASEYLQKALAARPAYPEALNNLGILYLRTGRPDDAKKSFAESIRVAPAFEQAFLNLARVYAIEGDKASARSTLLELLKLHPDQAQARKELEDLGQ